MPAWGTAAKLAGQAGLLLARHAQRIWSNLTAQERAEFFGLITPKNGMPYETKTASIPKGRVEFSKEEEKRLPRVKVQRQAGDKFEVKVPVPRPAYLKDLTDQEKDRLKFLIKKANTGVG